uniref:Uncharacterized protein n=1 Tax=viral metagenome TaxID=1070528 RepID=A0A6H1ZCC5_9ZZZZ
MGTQKELEPLERPMKWTPDEDMQIFDEVRRIQETIRQHGGTMPYERNNKALGLMGNHYAKMMEKAGKAKAMRDELFAGYLRDGGMTIGRAEGMAKGSEFGQKRSYYEAVAIGYLEMIQALKKVNDFHNNVANNKC